MAWFVYDRVHGKLRFFTKKIGWQPNFDVEEPLLAYKIASDEN